MSVARRAALPLLALLLAAVAAPARLANAESVRAEPSLDLALEWALGTRAGRSQKLELVAEPGLRVGLPRGAQLDVLARLRADAFDRLEPERPRPVEAAPLSRRRLLGSHAELELRELTLELPVGPAFLTAGKQQIVWGRSDGLKLLDVVNPQDFREFILDDFEDSRIPLWSLLLELPIRDVVAQLVWIPDPTHHEIPEPGALFAPTAPRFRPPAPPGVAVEVADLDRPGQALADSDVGVRLSTFFRGWDLSLVYLFQYDDFPVLRRRIDVGPSGPVVHVAPGYERRQLVGGAFANAFGNLTLRGEVGFSFDRWHPTADPRDADGVVRRNELAWVLGLDWYGFSETLLSLQLFQDWVPERGAKLQRDELETIVTALYRRELWNDTLVASGIWLHSLSDGDGLLRAKLEYELRDGWSVWAGADFFYGRSHGLFGQFAARDRVVCGLAVSL